MALLESMTRFLPSHRLVTRARVPAVLGLMTAFAAVGELPSAAAFQATKPPVETAPAEPSLSRILYKKPEFSPDLPSSIVEINRKLADGIDPRDNAVVLLVQTFGAEVFEAALQGYSMDMLGLQSVPILAPRLLFLEAYVSSLGTVLPENTRGEAVVLEDKVIKGTFTLWTEAALPGLTAYLDANEKALDVIVDASGKSKYFSPMLPEDETATLMSASLTIERRLPFVCKLLTARAMGRFRDDDFPAALSDLQAAQRLAALLSRGSPFDVSVVRASEMDGIAIRGILTMLASGKLTREQIAELRAVEKNLPAMSFCGTAADIGERAILMREIEILENDKDLRDEFFEVSDEASDKTVAKAAPALDWKTIRAVANALQDKNVEILKTQDRAVQNKLIDQQDEQFNTWDAGLVPALKAFSEQESPQVSALSEFVGKTMVMSLRPIFRMRRGTDDRMKNRRDLVAICLALAAWQKDHGAYPPALADLAPAYLPAIPGDAFTDKPFIYKVQADKSATVTSYGMNQEDDSAKPYTDDETIVLPPGQ